jgi:hypothetical protein
MEHAVDHVKQQLVFRRPAVSGRFIVGRLGASDDLPVEMLRGTFQNEAQHVGRAVMAQVATIQFLDRAVVDQSDADFGPFDPRALQNVLRGTPDALLVHDKNGLLVGNVDHEFGFFVQHGTVLGYIVVSRRACPP